MRCDIQQLAGRTTANDSSITPLATGGMTRSPSPPPRRVYFNEPEATRPTRPHYAPARPLRPAAANGNRVFIPSFRRDRQGSADRTYYGQNRQRPTTQQPSRIDPLCPKCANRRHDDVRRCPAIGKQCWTCLRFGHLRAACRAGGRMRE